MSTRSGKRIHSSFCENTAKPEADRVLQSERKTRSKRYKENVQEFVTEVKHRKRTNYVTYPTDDDMGAETVDNKEADEAKPARLLRKTTLKELNGPENSEPPMNVFKPLRTTRRTRKYAEDPEETQEKQTHVEEVINISKIKSKKDKKKKTSIPKQEVDVVTKKKFKKNLKKAKRSGSMVVEDIVPEDNAKDKLNKSNMSVDSFYSAAGSPLENTEENKPFDLVSPKTGLRGDTLTSLERPDIPFTTSTEARQTRSYIRLSSITSSENTLNAAVKASRKRKSCGNHHSSLKMNETSNTDEEFEEFDVTLTNVSKKRKSSIKDNIAEKIGDNNHETEMKNSVLGLDETLKRNSATRAVSVNTTYELETPKSDRTFDKSEISDCKNTTYEKPSELANSSSKEQTMTKFNSTYDKDSNSSQATSWTEKPLVLDTTFEKDSPTDSKAEKSEIVNTTYDKDSNTDLMPEPKNRKSSIINATYDKDEILSESIEDSNTFMRKSAPQTSQKQSSEMNSTFDKTEKSDSSLYKNKNLDVTFDKNSKSSLISSDHSNITLDNSSLLRISITSDDSKENMINTTPVLIESSLDESKDTSKVSLKTPTPVTPLQREGTYTKEGSEVDETLAAKLPTTPTRKVSLPSPGCTPFPFTKNNSSRVMNVTGSLKKSRSSSLAEVLPRATKVMFCSPVNNPSVVMQQRRKVIKSSLKGSNKSFVFEDTAPQARAAPRKRSLTHGEADSARVKRSRLALPAGGGRRARTASAGPTVKSAEPSSSSISTITPKNVEGRISRTKLPNFAALHQKEFSKMESLDECQERRARRARLLRTPTGAVTVLERSSPKDTSTGSKKSPNPPRESIKEQKIIKPKKSKEQDSKKERESKQPITPVKSLPTLKSLNPGYTRFGFKLNYDVNPFSIPTSSHTSLVLPAKKDTAKKDNSKPLKEIKAMKRQMTLPPLGGATSRREVAKQAVMREKSFTDKRSLIRNENRTVIKGVRTNRRFELQMQMRNID